MKNEVSDKRVVHPRRLAEGWEGVPSAQFDFSHGLTVEAWVKGAEARGEILQALVSQWSILDSFNTFDAFDANGINGLYSAGYFGAVFDGRHIYFVPEQHATGIHHGIVLRYDTQGDFHDWRSYLAFDAGQVDGLKTKGYYGGAFDGRYVYFIPRKNGDRRHNFVLRVDSRGDFMDPRSWEAFDAGHSNCNQGAAFDGRYLYLMPGYADRENGCEKIPSGNVIRYDTHAPFKNPSSWKNHDIFPQLGIGCFDGGAFDGRYIYFAPLWKGPVARYDTRRGLDDPSAWVSHDAAPYGMGICVGINFDGRYLYYVPYAHSTVVRFDTEGDFTNPAHWSAYDAAGAGDVTPFGFDGGFYDGKYVYLVPFVAPGQGEKRYIFHTHFLRYNPRRPFQVRGSWEWVSAEHTMGLKTIGYNAGAFDGRFFYLAPWRDGSVEGPGRMGVHGRILRYDTLGLQGTFSLRYCDYGHNGGLCAAVPGPSFMVNTDKGARYVAAYRLLEPGWHHLAGVYDGRKICLFIDGVLAGEREATGAVPSANRPVSVGRIPDGAGFFRGEIAEVRIAEVPRDADWIARRHEELRASV